MFGTSPAFPDAGFFPCLAAAFHFPYGLYGLGLCIGALALLILMVMRMGYSEGGEYDRQRNLVYSDKGTYGTAGFMSRKELTEVLDLVPDIRKHSGTILGELDHQVICIPPKTRFNGNLAVYGASGSKKTRAFCVNMILQCAARKSSLVICDPKSELYEKTSEYLRDQGYTVRVFNLVTPSASDSWNCLAEVGGQELMAQLFCDVIIKNTGGEERDHFWDSAEMNLLKALVLYVSTSYPKKKQNIGEVYQLIAASSEQELNALFGVLPVTHPAKAPYSIFKQASEGVRGGVIIGLGSRLQVFQNRDIRNITSYNEIDLELPGKQPCAYYCITSDQDSTFDFLSSLFLSFVFIRLVRYADEQCPGGELPVPVHVLGEELCACGVIPDLSRKISVIRSRNLSMSCVFQNLAGLQNRYPYNQWQEILGNCDVQLFLGCTDALTAEFISDRTGEASISVTSKAKQLGTWRVSNYTPEYRETSGVGRRKLMTMDEVLRMDIDKALILIRGKNVLEVDKYDYDGYLYTWAYTTKVEHPYLESKTVTETVTVNTAKNDLAQILAELSPSVPYEKDGFSGELALDHTTLSTEASGYTTKYSKTTETKVIGNLDRNDMSYVPATTVKNGKTLTLANVEWQVTGTALVGEALVPAQYQAVATYSASSSYQAATGYVTTAEYHGTVTSEGVDSITYTVVYTGSEIVPVKTHIWDNDSLAAPLLIIAAVLLCAGIAAAALILLRRRKNVYVYVPDSKPREYRLIAKFRVEPDSEVPAIDAGSLTLNPGDTVAVEVKKSLARHLAGREFTVSFPQSDHTYTIQASKHNDWHEFTVPAEEEQEAPV